MKKNWWVFFVLGGLVLISAFTYARAANSDVVINEIGGYATSTHEWVEIWNKGGESIDLTGWKFWEGNTKHGIATKVGDAFLAPGEYGVIVQDDARFMLDNPGFAGSVWDSSWGSLSESGEEIGLIDNSGAEIEKFIYPTFTNYSLERVNPFLNDYSVANWKEHANGNSLGLINSVFSLGENIPVTPTTTETTTTPDVVPATTSSTVEVSVSTTSTEDWAAIKINEIFPHPDTGGDEWVELYNTSSTAIDLSGGSLCDGRETGCTIAKLEGTIPANGFMTVSLSSSYLNNDGDVVILRNSIGEEVDRVVYGANSLPKVNEALAKNEAGEFVVTITPTPNTANVITTPVVPVITPVVNGGGGGGGTNNNNEKSVVVKISSSPTAAKVIPPKPETTVAWSTNLPLYAIVNETVRLSAENSADPRGGEIFYRWTWENEAYDGVWIEPIFFTTGTKHVAISATSTAGTVGTLKFNLPVLSRAQNLPIKISEVYSNPTSQESEFVELNNYSEKSLDLSGWSIVAGSGKYILPASTTIPAGQYRAFYKGATKLTLINSGGVVTLLTKDTELADEVVVPKLGDGQSYIKYSDGYKKTNEPTPGYENSWAEVLGEKIVAPKTQVVKTVANTAAKYISVGALADLNNLSSNQRVVALGVVSVLPNVFNSQSFYISDNTGSAEIYSSKKLFPLLTIGDRVRVVGEIGSGKSVSRIKIKKLSDIKIIGSTSSTPNVLSLNEVDEEKVGAIMKTGGEITQVKKNLFYVDDGTGEIAVVIKPGTKIGVAPTVGGRATVSGMIMRGVNGIELWPRGANDIAFEGLTIIPKAESNTYKPYAIITILGLVTFFMVYKLRERLVGGDAILATEEVTDEDEGVESI